MMEDRRFVAVCTASCCNPPGRHAAAYSSWLNRGHVGCSVRLPLSAFTGYIVPLNDTKYHVSPTRTAFSVTGSCSTSYNGLVRSLVLTLPVSSRTVFNSAPSPQMLKNERLP